MHFFKMRGSWNAWMAFMYDTFVAAGIDELYDQLVEFFFTDLPPKCRLLDLGCGSGQVAYRIAKKNPHIHVLGVDLSKAQINRARKREAGLKNLQFEIGDAMNLLYTEGSFDIVLSVASIKHWPDYLKGLYEMHRVCKKNGSMYVVEVDIDSTFHEARDFAARWKYRLPGSLPLLTRYFRKFIVGQGVGEYHLLDLIKKSGFDTAYVKKIPSQPLLVGLGIK